MSTPRTPAVPAPAMRADFPRSLSALSAALDLVEDFAREAGLSATLRSDLQFALDEVFTNMVKYNAAGGGPITVALTRVESEVLVAVSDPDSPRFDPTKDAPEVAIDRPLAERHPGGLGIHLLKRLAERVEYAYAGTTATITFRKRMD